MNNVMTRASTDVATIDEDMLLPVLQSSLYPGASIESIRMVLGYCKAAGLDPMQKPVHIVPMWDGKSGRMRDVVMPGINMYRIQASRSNQFAGVTEPEFGPDVSDRLGGQEITYPEWCKVTVKRVLANGVIADFTALEYWKENYAIKGGKDKSIAPNAMWTKRPRGQLVKCAEAQALRKAFPEIASALTADEMEGKSLTPDESTQVASSSCPAELLLKAKAAAGNGLIAYEEFFKAAGKDNRALLASHHAELKAKAVEVDKRRSEVINAETGEIEDDFVRDMEQAEGATQ